MRRRILTAVVLTTTLAVIAFFIPAAYGIRSAQRRGELLELQREASIVANRLANVGVADEAELLSILDDHHPVAIYSPDGTLLVGAGPTRPDRIVRLAFDSNFAEGYVDDDLVAARPVVIAGNPFVVRIEEPGSESQARYLRTLALLGAAGLAIIALAAGVGNWLAGRLNRPIDQLTAWASSRPRGDVPPPDPTGIDAIDSLRSAVVEDRSRIEELLDRERSFSSQVSHQLRTPVAAMRVAIETELAAPRPDTSAVLHESLGQLDRLESTISSLLALARHRDRELVECDLLDLTRTHAEHWRRPIEHAGRQLVVEGDALTARVDSDAVGHVLDVLLDNAIRHGSGDLRVEVRRADAGATIDVADEGCPPRERDPFAESGSDSSHGIGLRLARALAESSHGRLELLPAATTTFRFTLPA